ncbi:hypothetical protein AAC387_Pa09g0798 [Persea americana]
MEREAKSKERETENILKPFEESEKHKVEYEVHRLVVNRVTKAHFSPALGELKDQITNSDFITVSSNKLGVSSALWTRILPIDTSKTAYLKAKAAAKRFKLKEIQLKIDHCLLRGWKRKLDSDYNVMKTLQTLLFKVDWATSLFYTIEELMDP